MGDVVAGRCGGGGCGMKKEGMSLFVTHVTLESTFKRACALSRLDRACTQICSVHSFVVSVI